MDMGVLHSNTYMHVYELTVRNHHPTPNNSINTAPNSSNKDPKTAPTQLQNSPAQHGSHSSRSKNKLHNKLHTWVLLVFRVYRLCTGCCSVGVPCVLVGVPCLRFCLGVCLCLCVCVCVCACVCACVCRCEAHQMGEGVWATFDAPKSATCCVVFTHTRTHTHTHTHIHTRTSDMRD